MIKNTLTNTQLNEFMEDYIIINCAVVDDVTFILVARYSPPGAESNHEPMEKEPVRILTVNIGNLTSTYFEYEQLSRTINAAGGVFDGHKQALIADYAGTLTYYGYGYGGESGYEGYFGELSGIKTTIQCVTTIGMHFYVVGIKGIFRRDSYGQYTMLTEEITDYYRRQNTIPQLVSVDGFSETDLYALERNCIVWHYDGDSWEQEDLPVNVEYCDTIICAPDGNVYLIANAGEVIVKRNGQWEAIITDDRISVYQNCCWFKGKLYLANEGRPRYLDLDKKEWIKDERLPRAKSISANDNVMILTHLWDAYIFDGETLTCIYRNGVELNKRGVALAAAQITHTALENHPEIMELLEKAVDVKNKKDL